MQRLKNILSKQLNTWKKLSIKPHEASKYALTQSEEQLHIMVIKWAQSFDIYKNYLFHIPNGGYRHPKEAKKLKQMGVKPGICDLFFAYPSGNYHGMWIELKSVGGCLSTTQRNWIRMMRDVGYYVACVNNFDDFVKEITFYKNLNLTKELTNVIS